MASTSLYKTFGSGNQQTWTWSGWVKKAALCNSANDFILFNGYQNNDNRLSLFYSQTQADGKVNDCLALFGTASASTTVNAYTSALYRDVNGWYHVVCAFDTTQSTGSDRIKIWVNGVSQSLTFVATPSQNSNQSINFAQTHTVGGYNISDGAYFDGEMSHVHFIDGTAYDADTFGETDSTTGIWKPKTAPSVTYGTNGFFLKFENSGSMGTDSSGNANNFTVNGTLTQTVDTPSNVFATWNALQPTGATLSNGNTTGQSSNGNYISGVSTLGVTKGKYYAEFKLSAESASGESIIGVTANVRPTSAIAGQTGNWGIRNNNGYLYYTSSGTASDATGQHANFTTGDIIGVGLDMDNGHLYLSKNGQWNASNTWSSATPSQIIYLDLANYDEYFFECGDAGASVNATWQSNFGNGYFGTSPVSSATTDESGLGTFEYTVPTGYYALCTKNINEQEYS
jgi:hypothetical protein